MVIYKEIRYAIKINISWLSRLVMHDQKTSEARCSHELPRHMSISRLLNMEASNKQQRAMCESVHFYCRRFKYTFKKKVACVNCKFFQEED